MTRPDIPRGAHSSATGYGWIVLALLTLANSFAFVDRQVLALLLQPIKQDLGASDTVMSLLYGVTFSLFYATLGLPMARLADRSSRRRIIAASIFAWSLMTMVCGLARSFPTLFAARVGVGAGEAGMAPAAQSMLADYFPPERLSLALGIFAMGIYIGGGMALMIGGVVIHALDASGGATLPLVGHLKPWQLTFMLVGAPGIVLAAAMLLVREPARRGPPRVGSVPFAQMWAHLRARRSSYIGIIVGLSLMILVGQGTAAWIPSFFARRFGWGPQQIGLQYGLVVFVCGCLGTVTGGAVAAWLRRRGEVRASLISAAIGFAVLIPITIAFPLMPTPALALALIGAMNFFAGFPFGGCYAALQEITPNRMRAQMAAVMLLGVNLIGAAGGPTAIALTTDRMFGDPAMLHWSMALVAAVVSPLAFAVLCLALVNHRASVGALEDRG